MAEPYWRRAPPIYSTKGLFVQIVGFGGVLLYIREQRRRYGGPPGSLGYYPAGSEERALYQRIRSWEIVMVKSWATRSQFLHPHMDPAGATCGRYGVYAMPRSQQSGQATDLRDPWSIGLVTFTRTCPTCPDSDSTPKRVPPPPVSLLHAHGVAAKVATDQWGDNRQVHKDPYCALLK